MICRVCLSECDDSIDILSDERIPQYITKFLQLELTIEDPVSKVICELCWRELENFANFHLLVSEAQCKLSIVHEELTKIVNQNEGDSHIKETFVDEFFTASPELTPPKKENTAEKIEDATVDIADALDYFEIFELHKEEVIEPATTIPPHTKDLPSVENITCPSRKKHAFSQENISEGTKRKYHLRSTRIDQKQIEKGDINVHQKHDHTIIEVKKGRTERSAKLWEKSQEFDEIINTSMQLVCNICAKNLTDFRDLQSHFRRAHKTKGYAVCCNKRLYKRGMLVHHISSYHQRNCRFCGIRASSVYALQKHANMCAKRIAGLGERTKAKRIMTERNAKIWKKSKEFDKMIKKSMELFCDICAVRLIDFRNLQLHFRRYHGIRGYIVCCCKRWYKRGLLLEHIKTHNQKLYYCKECGKGSWSKADMQKHRDMCTKRIESLEDETAEANHCFQTDDLHPNTTTEAAIISPPEISEKSSKRAEVLKQEKPVASEVSAVKRKRGRPRKGNEKQKKDISERSMKLWEKSREFDKIIKENMNLFCQICNANLIDFAELQRHFRHVHRQRGYAVCCNVRLYKRPFVVGHINAHKRLSCPVKEGEEKPKAERVESKFVKRYDEIIQKNMNLVCDICSMRIVDFAELKRHFRLSHKQKGYVVCCNNRMYTRSLLVAHIKCHKKKSCTCNLCGQACKETCTKDSTNSSAISTIKSLKGIAI